MSTLRPLCIEQRTFFIYKQFNNLKIMETISVKALRPIKMTAKTLVFEGDHGAYRKTYMATRRVANDILAELVDEVVIVDTILPKKFPDNEPRHVQMLATPSCW